MYRLVKRLFDLIISTVAIILLSPAILILAVLIYFKIDKKIFFIQERVGLNNRVFKIYKFKTMIDARDKEGNLLPDEIRLTKFSKLFRSLSLDELPQLLNVIRGDLSLVGPRPLYVEYLPLYSDEQKRRHDVKPGITGWAQVNGRNAISWEDKFKFDVWYVDHKSLLLDLKILVLTFIRVFQRQGVSQPNHVTMEKFKG